MNCRVRVDADHADQLQRILDEVQKCARVRTIEAQDVIQAVSEIEKRLIGRLSLTKKACIGIAVEVDLRAQSFPAAYNGRPESTQFTVSYNGRYWTMTSAGRATCSPGRYWIKAWPDAAVTCMLARNQKWD